MSDDNGFELSRRKALGGLLSLGVAGAASGAGTYALFSDTEQSTGNTVQAGTLDLSSIGNSTFSLPTDGISPGDSLSGSVDLTNSGSVAGDHVEITTAVTENDRNDENGESDTGDPNPVETAKRLFVDAAYPSESNYGGFAIHAQLAGSYVYEVGSGAKVSVKQEQPSGGNVGNGPVHFVSDGDTADTAKSMVDVSSAGYTVDALSSGTFEYQYHTTSSNTVNAPDEVELVLEDSDGIHFVYQQAGSSSTTGNDGTRNVAAELDGSGGPSGQNGWKEFDLATGNVTTIGSDLTSDYSSATVKRVGVRAGNFDGDADTTLDIYYGGLTLDDGTTQKTPAFRVRPTSLRDLEQATLDNLTAPSGSTKTFDISVTLDSEVENDFQGDGVDTTFTFGLAQKSGQDVL